MNSSFPVKTDSESVIGDFFECQQPNMMCTSLTLMVKKLHGRSQTQTIIITGARLDVVELISCGDRPNSSRQ